MARQKLRADEKSESDNEEKEEKKRGVAEEGVASLGGMGATAAWEGTVGGTGREGEIDGGSGVQWKMRILH